MFSSRHLPGSSDFLVWYACICITKELAVDPDALDDIALHVDLKSLAIAFPFCPPTDVDRTIRLDDSVETRTVRVDHAFLEPVLVLQPNEAVKVLRITVYLSLNLVVRVILFTRSSREVNCLVALHQELLHALHVNRTLFDPLQQDYLVLNEIWFLVEYPL